MKNEELKKAAIIRAEGEAEAAKLIADAVGRSGPGKKMLHYRDRSDCDKKDRGGAGHYRDVGQESERDVRQREVAQYAHDSCHSRTACCQQSLNKESITLIEHLLQFSLLITSIIIEIPLSFSR
jgi:hypothetical protein